MFIWLRTDPVFGSCELILDSNSFTSSGAPLVIPQCMTPSEFRANAWRIIFEINAVADSYDDWWQAWNEAPRPNIFPVGGKK